MSKTLFQINLLSEALMLRVSNECRTNLDVMRVAQHSDRQGYDKFVAALEKQGRSKKKKVESSLVGEKVESKVPGLRYN